MRSRKRRTERPPSARWSPDLHKARRVVPLVLVERLGLVHDQLPRGILADGVAHQRFLRRGVVAVLGLGLGDALVVEGAVVLGADDLAAVDGQVRLLVGADGASSVIRRRVGVHFTSEDFSYALGWHVRCPSDRTPERIDIKYLKDFTGYIWAFPRTDHVSYGIASKYREWTPAQLKDKLRSFMASEQVNTQVEWQFYAAMLPALAESSWDRLRVVNDAEGWALIGDAAGFVDPLTGEGIYYSLKSADLLAKAVETKPGDYEEMWRREFGAELRRASQLQSRFYHGKFAGKPFVERMVQFAGWHRGVRNTLGDLIAGSQSYVELKSRLKRQALRVV